MAEIKQGILGGVSGKVGTVVGASWKGKNIIRAVPRKTGKKATQAQLNQRSRFKLVSNFLRPVNRLLRLYFGANQGLKSRVNLALAYHLQEAVIAEEEGIAIQVEKVLLSKGILPSLKEQNAGIANGTLTLTWTMGAENSLEHPTDLLTVVVYEKETKSFEIFERIVAREALSFATPLADNHENAVFSVWFFMTNAADTECSTSVFWNMNDSNE